MRGNKQMNIKFREAKLKDKEFILSSNKEINILSGLNDSTFDNNIDKDLFEDKVCKAIIAEIDNNIAGFVLYSYIYWANCGKGIYLSQAYVEPQYRKQGILKMLLNKVESREKECNFITNLVGSENETMIKALDKLNFKSSDLITYYRKIKREADNSSKTVKQAQNRILITGAVLTSNNNSIDTYNKLISWLDKNTYEISSPLDTMKFKGNDSERYDRAMQLLQDTKLIIAEMSNISTGQGIELQEAATLNIPVLVIAKNNSKISGLVKGCKNVKEIIYYDNIEDIKDNILDFINKEL